MPVAANDARVQQVAFAHLVGNDIDYRLKKYEITLGRKAKNYVPDISMGDTKSVSRQHANIAYNFDTKQFELIILGRNGAVVDGVSYLPEDGPVPLKSKALVQIGEASFYFLLPKKLSKLFASSGKSVVENLKTTAGVPSNTGNTLESGAAGAPPAPAAAAAPATTTMPASGSMPSKQEMMQLIQEAAARQQQQQVMAATLASAQQQQQQQLALLSPVQQLALMQQMQHQRQVASSGAANLSPQQQMQMQLLLQQQQLLIRQQQQQQQQNSLPK